MKHIIPIFCCFLLIPVISNSCWAQRIHSSQIEPVVLHHEIDVFLGSTHIPEGGKRVADVTLVLPNIGFNYKYWFGRDYGISLSNDWYLSPKFYFDILGSDIEVYSLGPSAGRKF